MRKVFLVPVCVALAGLSAALPAAASASIATVQGCDFVVCGVSLTAQPGETNDVRVSRDAGPGLMILEDSAGIQTASCEQLTPTSVRCPATIDNFFRLDDQDDQVTVIPTGDPSTELGVSVNGGTGNDRVIGGASSDSFLGNAGADVFVGGGGHDSFSYADRQSAIKARIGGGAVSGNAADGPNGARDNIDATVEQVWGGAGDDLLRGNEIRNYLYGGLGDDKLVGGSNKDVLMGEAGDDYVIAKAHDKDNVINCGAGTDRARVDRRDPNAKSCEDVSSR